MFLIGKKNSCLIKTIKNAKNEGLCVLIAVDYKNEITLQDREMPRELGSVGKDVSGFKYLYINTDTQLQNGDDGTPPFPNPIRCI